MRKATGVAAIALTGLSLGACGTIPAESAPTPHATVTKTTTSPAGTTLYRDAYGNAGVQTVEYWMDEINLTNGQLTEIRKYWEGEGIMTKDVAHEDAANGCAMSSRGMTISEISDSVGHVPFGKPYTEQLYQAGIISYEWFTSYVTTVLHEACPEAITPEK